MTTASLGGEILKQSAIPTGYGAGKVGEKWRVNMKTCPTDKVPLLAIEIPEMYDGISYYHCLVCKRFWDRWTGKEVKGKDRPIRR